MINLLFLISSLNRGGAENQLLELATRINQDKYRLHIISFQGLTGRTVALHAGVWKEMRFSGFKSLSTIHLLRLLARYCREQEIDIIQSFFFTENVLASLISRQTGIKHVISVRNLLPYSSLIQKQIQRTILRRCSMVLANAATVKRRVLELGWVEEQKVRVIYNGIDTTAFDLLDTKAGAVCRAKERLGIHPDTFVILLTANFRPEKNHRCLLQAMSFLKQNGRDVRAVLVGDGPLREEMEHTAQDLAIEDRVLFAGATSDVVPFILAADVGVLVSTHEGLSNALLEYMAAGIPVIASNVGGNSEVVSDCETGFLFESNDFQTLAKRLNFLMDHRTEMLRMGEAAHCRVRECFSMNAMVQSYEDFYAAVHARK